VLGRPKTQLANEVSQEFLDLACVAPGHQDSLKSPSGDFSTWARGVLCGIYVLRGRETFSLEYFYPSQTSQ
jgi:hypothetical protein